MNSLHKIYVPPIKIQGIKTKLVKWILEQVDFSTDGKWVEPFMGSGVVGFNFRPKKALFADINPHIINFYNAIKKGDITSQRARIFLTEEGKKLFTRGEKYYYYVRDRFNDEHEPLDFLFLNRACFNGLVRFNKQFKFNTPFGHKINRFSKSYITKIVNQIKYVENCLSVYDWNFICQDFRNTIISAKPDDFIYCDPPYIKRHTDYFNSWSEKDEVDLYNLLKNFKGKFILSTWHSNKYRENEFLTRLWKNFNILTKKHFYHIGAKELNRNSMLEALVMNYNPKIIMHNKSTETKMKSLFEFV